MGGDNVGRGSFGCVACTSLTALIFYAVGLSMPVWSGYYVNDRKCERDDGCGYNDKGVAIKKGEDVPATSCQYQTHGIYIWIMAGPTKPGMEATKEAYKKSGESEADREKSCKKSLQSIATSAAKTNKDITKSDIDDAPECTWNEDSLSCACPWYSKDMWWKMTEKVSDKKEYCEDKKKKYDDIKTDATKQELERATYGNIALAAITLIAACACHFLAMIMAYIGLATGHFALGIIAACLNILAIACGITGLVTGTAGAYLAMTAKYCGSWKWYKEAQAWSIPQPDDQVHPMGMGAIMVIVGLVFSVISACSACGSVAAAKRAAAQDAADSSYNKF